MFGVEHQVRNLLKSPAFARPERRIAEQDVGPFRALEIPMNRHDVFLLEFPQRSNPASDGASQSLEGEARPFGFHPGLLRTEATRALVVCQPSH